MTAASDVSVTPERIQQMAWGFIPPLVIEAAISNRVFDILDGGARSLAEIAASSGASPRGLAAIMNALVGLNLLTKDAQDRYALTPESAAFLVRSKPSYQGGVIAHTSSQLLPKWLKLNDIVKTGQPSAAVNQEGTGAEFFQQFVVDLFPMNYPAAKALAASFDLSEDGPVVHVLDLAAGSGVWGIALAQSSPRVRVTALDWADVLPVTQKTVEALGLRERFRFTEGDLLTADFGREQNIVTLGHILHSEGEERGRRLLGKVHEALAAGGTIAIAEFLVNDDRRGPVNGLFFAVNMLVNTEKGDTYSFEEISRWLKDAGFTDMRMLPVLGPSPLILATKA